MRTLKLSRNTYIQLPRMGGSYKFVVWLWRGLPGLLALIVILGLAGATYQANATQIDQRNYPPPGQVYERLALKLTSLNIKSAFLNQPIEVAALRSQFQSAMGLGAAAPQLLIRFGYAEAMPRSLHRPVEQVLL